MTRRLAAVTVLTVALGAMPLATQGAGQHPGGPGMPGMMGAMDAMGPIVHMLQQLDLSDTQKQQIHSLVMQTVQNDDQAQQIRTAERQLHAALLADVPDERALDTIKTTLNAAHAAELDRHVSLMVKIAQILTPDQRQQLLKMAPPPAPGR